MYNKGMYKKRSNLALNLGSSVLQYFSKYLGRRWKFLSDTYLWLAKSVSLKSFRLCPVQTPMLLPLIIVKPGLPHLVLTKVSVHP